MRELTIMEIKCVAGGDFDDPKTDTDKVKENAATAIATCGEGKVKSVSTTGFECKA